MYPAGSSVRPRRPSALAALQALVASALGLPLFVAGCDAAVACDSPTDRGGGLDSCEGGLVVRREAVTCESTLPRANASCSQDPMLDQCATDADCTDQPNGHCESSSGFDGPSCFCSYGCTTDDECGPGAICVCGDPVGHCESATCNTSADCDDGQLCGFYESTDTVCHEHGWACTTSSDECTTNADCEAGFECIPADGARKCRETQPCAIGRPFLVDEAPRLAELRFGDATWSEAGCPRPTLLGELGPAERERLAARWSEIGLMEHASVAAFARFTLELLALGAPPRLVEETQQAIADETRHARVAFAIASSYAGQPIGPGRLSIAGALAPVVEPLALLRVLFREGCVGETVAALEAAEGATRCEDEVVARVLDGIAADESRHAALAWAAVRWLLELTGDAGLAVLEDELELAFVRDTLVGDPLEVGSLRHGLLGEDRRAALRWEVVANVVVPAVRGLGALDLAGPTTVRAS